MGTHPRVPTFVPPPPVARRSPVGTGDGGAQGSAGA